MHLCLLIVLASVTAAHAEDSAPAAHKPLYLQLTEGHAMQASDRAHGEKKMEDAKATVNAFNDTLEKNGLVQNGDASKVAEPAAGAQQEAGSQSAAPPAAIRPPTLGVRVPIATAGQRQPAGLAGFQDRRLTPDEEAAAQQVKEQIEKLKETLSKSLQDPY